MQQVVAYLPDDAAVPIKGDLNLTLLDWYTDGVPAEEAAQRIRRSAGRTCHRTATDRNIIFLLKPTGRLMAVTEAKMHSTFVPDEALTPTRPILFGPDGPSPKPRSGVASLGTPEIRYDLFRSRHEPELYCAVPEGRPGPAFVHSDRWLPVGRVDEAAATPLGFDRKAAKQRFGGWPTDGDVVRD